MVLERNLIMRLVLVVLFLISLSSISFGKDVIVVAVPKDGYPPYLIVSDEQVSGIMIQALNEALKPLSIEVNIRYLEEVRSKSLLDRKIIDARMESPNWVHNPKRYLWSEPIAVIQDKFVFLESQTDVFEKDESMSGAILSVHVGYAYPTLQSHFEEKVFKRSDYATEKAMLQSLIRKQDEFIRAAVMDENVAKWLISNNDQYQGRFRFSKRYVDSTPIHFQFSNNKKMRSLQPKINQRLMELKSSGRLNQIINDTLM